MRHTVRLIVLLGACLALGACGSSDEDRGGVADASGGLRVAAAFYPLEEIARAVGGARASVTGLTPPGSGPHDLELRASQVVALERADVIVFLGAGFQPAVEKLVAQRRGDDVIAIDLFDEVTLRRVDPAVPGVRGDVDGEVLDGDRDPHVWVDPARFAELVDTVNRTFATADPDGAATYARNAAAYRAKVLALDAQFDRALNACRTQTLVTSHAAFGYLADRYGLAQAPIAGITPDDEPDPKSLAATARKAKADGVKTVFFETLVPRKLADTVAREIGARSDALDPVEGLTRQQLDAGESYLTIQRENLRRLSKGLRCTA